MKRGIFILWIIYLSCNGSIEHEKKGVQSYLQTDSNNNIEKKEKVKIVDTTKKTLTQKGKIYDLLLKNDTINQEMKIQYEGNNKINFSLITLNKLNDQTDTLKGIATKDLGSRSDEYDQSEDGTAFLYDTWHYVNGKCQLEFRIADSAQFVRIFEFNCNTLRNLSCPYETGGVLERVHFQ